MNNTSGQSQITPNEVEIDLGYYLLVIVAWWREIILIPLLAGLIAFGIASYLQSAQPVKYRASTNVVLAVLRSQIQLDERVNTTVEPQIGANNNDRRSSLVALIHDAAVVQAVLAELGDQLPSNLREPSALTSVVSVEVPDNIQNNVLTINATTRSAELSSLIANVWAEKYTAHINQLYSDVPITTLVAVEAELDKALADYEAAQTALESFIGNNQMDELNRLISEKVALRDSLILAYTQATTTVVNAQSEAQTQAYAYLAKRPVNVAISELTAEEVLSIDIVNDLKRRRYVATIHLERARNLERQLSEGGEAAAQTAGRSLQLLKDQIFASATFGTDMPPSSSYILDASGTDVANAETLLADVRALIAMLETYVEELTDQVNESNVWASIEPSNDQLLQAMIAATPNAARNENEAQDVQGQAMNQALAAILTPSEANAQLTETLTATDPATRQLVETLEGELQTLRASLAAETNRELRLTQDRDLAWNTYSALQNKLLELNLLRTSASLLLRPTGAALTLTVPPSSYLLPVAFVGFVAFIGMVLLALIMNALGGKPFFSRGQTNLRHVKPV